MKLMIQELVKYYNKFKALDSINLSIENGEFVCILGPSGCGKTTLLRIIAGFEKPDRGVLKIDDKLVSSSDFNLPPDKRNIGMVFQSYALWPHMSVRQHLEFVVKYNKNISNDDKKNINDTIKRVLELTKLNDSENKYPYQLSGGQKQRVAIARALVFSPSILLMDEPLSNLDAELRESLRREIQNIHHITNNTIIYVTHDQAEAMAMADRIVVMRNGRIEQIGKPHEVYLNPINSFVASFVSKANLIKGIWENDTFLYVSGENKICFKKPSVNMSFRQNSVCPIRPEELDISTTNRPNSINGTIKNIEYQGKGIYITVEADNNTIMVFTNSCEESFKIGQNVYVFQKELKPQPVYI